MTELHPPADGFRDGPQARNKVCENFGDDGLFAVALGELRRIVHFDHDRVGPGGDRGERHLRNKLAQTDPVGRIDHDGQMGFRLQKSGPR